MNEAAGARGLLTTPGRKAVLFTALYLSEGAPIGFLWVALPTQLRADGVPLAEVTALAALLVAPWTFKFAWAPLIDMAARRVALPWLIVGAQSIMGATLASLLVLDPGADFTLLRRCLLLHAFAAATQDVAIDAWCIRVSVSAERARLNGWMQVGMLLGRSLLGGGALLLAARIGRHGVVVALIAVTTFSGLLALVSRAAAQSAAVAARPLAPALRAALGRRSTWVGLLFALTAGAGARALEVVSGPFLVDRGYTTSAVGWLLAGPLIAATMIGSLLGGAFGDRLPRDRVVIASLAVVVAGVVGVAGADVLGGEQGGLHLVVPLGIVFLANGVFTAMSYALFMDLAAGPAAATLFSAFMGATNGCEAWAVYSVGRVEPMAGYPGAFLMLGVASASALWLVPRLGRAGT